MKYIAKINNYCLTKGNIYYVKDKTIPNSPIIGDNGEEIEWDSDIFDIDTEFLYSPKCYSFNGKN